jgi:O-antigen ligase
LGGMYFWAVKTTKPITQAGFVVLGVVFVWLLYEYLLSDIYSVLLATGSGGDPTSGRLAMYATAFHILIEGIKNSEWGAFFGYGFNSTASLFDERLKVTITIFDIEIVSEKATFGKDRLHLHNFFLQTLFEFGLFGFGAYVYMLWRFLTHSKTFALFTVVGMLSGLLSGTFYVYSVYYVVLLSLYIHENNIKFGRLPI